MKRNIGIFALLLLVLMMLFVSCEAQPELPDSSGGNGDVAPPAGEEDAEVNPLVGRWGFAEDNTVMIFEFTEYGTFTWSIPKEEGYFDTTTGRYEVNDDIVTLESIELEDFIKTYEFSIDGNELSLTIVAEDVPESYATITLFNIDEKKNDVHIDEDLLGMWIVQDDLGYLSQFELTASGLVFLYRPLQSEDANLVSELRAATTYTLDETKPGSIFIGGAEGSYVLEDGTLILTERGTSLAFTPYERDGESIELTDLVGSYVAQEGYRLIIFEDGSMLDFDEDGEIFAERLILDITNDYILYAEKSAIASITAEYSLSIEDDSLTIADVKYTKVDDSTDFSLDGKFMSEDPSIDIRHRLGLREDGTYAIYGNDLMTTIIEEGEYSIVGNKVFVGDKTFVLRIESLVDVTYTHLYWVEEDILVEDFSSLI